MKISTLNQISYPQFQAKITKNSLKQMDLKAQEIQLKQLAQDGIVPLTAIVGGILVNVDDFFKENGFTHETTSEGYLNLMAGYNGGFYTIDPVPNAMRNINVLKESAVKILVKDPSGMGGLLNYKDCVNDLKRQDIIQKGLNIHTYQLDSNLTTKQKNTAAKNLSKYLGRTIEPKDLFFIGSEGFYYNKYAHTVFGVNISDRKEGSLQPVFKECRFELDKNGNTIGYTAKNWNAYYKRVVDETYMEQQEPSYKLDSIVDCKNNKDMAEAFRFGNNEPDFRLRAAAPNILNHLTNRVKIASPKEQDIQHIKFYDAKNNIVTRFGYYDSSVGHSFVYDVDGKYLYQMEYIKDDFGNIKACARI